MKAKTTFSLKDQLFNPEKVAYLTGLVSNAHPAFAVEDFQHAVVSEFPNLELKQRITHMSNCLATYLPDDYLAALQILLAALPPALDPTKTDDDFGDFILAPFGEFVAMFGCSAEFLPHSLSSLKEMTKRFTVEGPIRPFISAFSAETMAFLLECSHDENYHVRRLASEGTRPKLPWAPKITIDYHEPMAILNNLFADPTRYVTRSVANHLNDIAKLDPDHVIETLAGWEKTGQQDAKEFAFIKKHALRTLVKDGNHAALTLLGFGETPNITIRNLHTTTPEVPIGTKFNFSFELDTHTDQNLLVDYIMTFANPQGKKSQKVFKLKQIEAKSGKTFKIKKNHLLKLMTTRQLYAGTHTIMLQVNGKPFDKLSFELVEVN